MKPVPYPFAAVVAQQEMKLALLLAAVDFRLGVLLRGDKGSGKTTCARGLAAVLPDFAPFINLPVGATEDRLLGGLHIERALQGDPVLKPGLLAEAHGGVLYVDEVNLLPAHLGDALLDAAASGIHTVEREGLSASHPAEFVLLGSMNPEEGSLRPQLLDRFALCVTVAASLDPEERAQIMQRRMEFERDASAFAAEWSLEQSAIRDQITYARGRLRSIDCAPETLQHISTAVCERGVRSLRADLAVMRAAIACAALAGDDFVHNAHIDTVLPLALAHRTQDSRRRPPAPPNPSPDASPDQHPQPNETPQSTAERIFTPRAVEAPALHTRQAGPGPVARTVPSPDPRELDLRATLTHALQETGAIQPRASDLHERIRTPAAGTRFLFLIDSSGSHAARERMRLVKGAAVSLLERSFRRGDEVALVVFRGASAEVLLQPSSNLADAITALEYLPTGGRTPLAHGLAAALPYATARTILIVITDARANYPLHSADAWQDAMTEAAAFHCAALVVDTEVAANPLGQAKLLAATLHARHVSLDELASLSELSLATGGRAPDSAAAR